MIPTLLMSAACMLIPPSDADLSREPSWHLLHREQVCRGLLLGLRNTHPVGELCDLGEVPIDGLARRAGERRRPVAEQLGVYGERRTRHGTGMCEPLYSRAVRHLRAAADGVGDAHRVVAVLQSLD